MVYDCSCLSDQLMPLVKNQANFFAEDKKESGELHKVSDGGGGSRSLIARHRTIQI